MAWVQFTRDFEFDFRPQRAVCQLYRASSVPQELPERVVAAAVAAGAAVRVHIPAAQKVEIRHATRRKNRSTST